MIEVGTRVGACRAIHPRGERAGHIGLNGDANGSKRPPQRVDNALQALEETRGYLPAAIDLLRRRGPHSRGLIVFCIFGLAGERLLDEGFSEPVDRILDLASRALDQYAFFEDAAAVYMHVIGAKQLAERSLQ